jgi:flagellar basal-body rod modification protein FlgD
MPAIDPTAATSPLAAATGTTTRSNGDFGKDAFLKLLVAQLKYQDPMKPADGAEFMAQTAQLQMVEKLEELSAQNAELLASQRTLAGSNLIGRAVTYPGAGGFDVTGTVDGVRLTVDGPVLRIGAEDVPLGAVKEIAPSGTA